MPSEPSATNNNDSDPSNHGSNHTLTVASASEGGDSSKNGVSKKNDAIVVTPSGGGAPSEPMTVANARSSRHGSSRRGNRAGINGFPRIARVVGKGGHAGTTTSGSRHLTTARRVKRDTSRHCQRGSRRERESCTTGSAGSGDVRSREVFRVAHVDAGNREVRMQSKSLVAPRACPTSNLVPTLKNIPDNRSAIPALEAAMFSLGTKRRMEGRDAARDLRALLKTLGVGRKRALREPLGDGVEMVRAATSAAAARGGRVALRPTRPQSSSGSGFAAFSFERHKHVRSITNAW